MEIDQPVERQYTQVGLTLGIFVDDANLVTTNAARRVDFVGGKLDAVLLFEADLRRRAGQGKHRTEHDFLGLGGGVAGPQRKWEHRRHAGCHQSNANTFNHVFS